MSVHYIEHPEDRMIELIVEGTVTEEDFDAIRPRMEAFLASNGRTKLLEIIRHFDWPSWNVIRKGINFEREHAKDISHCAVVSDNPLVSMASAVASPFISMEIRSFRLKQEDQAREWLNACWATT